MLPNPREQRGPFYRLLKKIHQCKAAHTCPDLPIRSFYFEPNSRTAALWQRAGLYRGKLDRRVVFVCESPGPSGRENASIEVQRCWADSWRDKRFQEIRRQTGLHHSYITNTVKCGFRQGRRHTDEELWACTKFLIQELELLRPRVVVGVGGNAFHTLSARVLPGLSFVPIPFCITHYAGRGEVEKAWESEFGQLKRLLARVKP